MKSGHEIFSEYIYHNGEKYGFIRLEIALVTYYVNVYLFDISSPVETAKTGDYNYALHKFTIMRNKYNK